MNETWNFPIFIFLFINFQVYILTIKKNTTISLIMRKLLIPTNFSTNSKNAIFYGIEIAKQLNKQIVLLQVIDIYDTNFSEGYSILLSQNISSKMEQEAEAALTARYEIFQRELHERYPTNTPDVEFVQKKGNIIDEILTEATKDEIDMVLVTGRSNINEISDINSKIIEKSLCPVWIIPPGVKFRTFKKVVYTTNYKPKDVDTLKKFIQIAGSFQSEIHLFHMSINLEFIKQLMGRGFQEIVKDATNYNNIELTVKQGVNLIRAIDAFAKKISADLIVMLKESDSYFHNIFTGSHTRKIVFQSEIPVLIYHEANE